MSGVVVRYAYAMVSHAPLKPRISPALRSSQYRGRSSSPASGLACNSLTGNHDLVTKIYFPKEIFPMAAVLACLFDFFVAFSALSIILAFMKVGCEHLSSLGSCAARHHGVFCMGIGMIVSAASLFFRDVKYIVEIFLTFGIFFTPVFYDVRMFGDRGKWLMLNPVAPLLDGLSACIAHHESPDIHWYLYSLVFSSDGFLGRIYFV